MTANYYVNSTDIDVIELMINNGNLTSKFVDKYSYRTFSTNMDIVGSAYKNFKNEEVLFYHNHNIVPFISSSMWLNTQNLMKDMSIKPQNILNSMKFCHNLDVKAHVDKYKNINYVWITNPSKPKKISDVKDKSFLNNIQSHVDLLKGYNFNIWTNLNKDTFSSMHKELLPEMVNVLEIDKELDLTQVEKNIIYNFDKYNSAYKALRIDLSKYLILEAKGGFMIDMNFEFFTVPSDELLCISDSIILNKNSNLFYIENGGFFAKQHHPIFQNIRKAIDYILHDTSYLMQIRQQKCGSDFIADSFSMNVLQLMFLQHANRGKLNDFLTTSEKKGDHSYYCQIDFNNLKFYKEGNDKCRLVYENNFDDAFNRAQQSGDEYCLSLFGFISFHQDWYQKYGSNDACLAYQDLILFGKDHTSYSWHGSD